ALTKKGHALSIKPFEGDAGVCGKCGVMRIEILPLVSRRHCEFCAFSLAERSFPVDGYSCRGNMRCKARQELCRSDRLRHYNALSRLSDRLLPRDAASHAFDALSYVHARKPFRIRTSEKRLCKPPGISTCKIIGLKVS